MAFDLFIMIIKNLYIHCIILGGGWLLHIIYFVFDIKNINMVNLQINKEKAPTFCRGNILATEVKEITNSIK